MDTKRIEGKACVSTSLLCEYFGVTKQAVNKWGQQGCPKAARGYWCVSDVLAWKGELAGSVGSDLDDMPLKEQKMYWETRCKEEQAENQKFKNAILRGDYLEKTQVEKDLSDYHIVLKQSVLSLPRKSAIIAAQYIGNDRARKLENDLMEVMIDVLNQWSQDRFEAAVDSKHPPRSKASGKNNGKPVGGREQGARCKKQQ